MTPLAKLLEAALYASARPIPSEELAALDPEASKAALAAALDELREHYDVDPKRVYLTGLSCGAIGGWDYLGQHTDETVAAAVLVCGDGRQAFQFAGCDLGKVPIWAFHGEDDPTVTPAGSIETLTNLQACTNPTAVDAKLTTYPGVGHDSWTTTYDPAHQVEPGRNLYQWMLQYTRP